MHLIFQFPIVDCRPLLPKIHGKLRHPNWPRPNINSKPFISRFGAVKERNSGDFLNWPSEPYFCNSHSVMRYTDLHKQGFDLTPYIKTDVYESIKEHQTDGFFQAAIYDSYRRYSSDKNFVGKIEAGFIDNIEKKINAFNIPEGTIDLRHILQHYANLPVKIKKNEVKLYKAGPLLANRYYEESTQKGKKLNTEKNYVKSGEIVVALTFSAKNGFKLPKSAFAIKEIPLPNNYGALKVYGYKLKHEGYTLKVWLIEAPNSPSLLPQAVKTVLRDLRINLVNIHSEKEALRILLNGLKNKDFVIQNNSEEARILDKYFEKTGAKLFKKERFNLEQKNLLDFALNSEEAVAPGSLEWLEEDVDYLQDSYIRANIKKLNSGMKKKMVLFVCASPKGKNALDFGYEFKILKESLESAMDKSNYDIEIETAVKDTKFLDLLNKYKPDYLHLSMHSSLTDGLYFEGENRTLKSMSVEKFKEIIEVFSEYHKPVVILLSACNSIAHAQAVQKYCKYAIGTQTVFPEDAGVLYASKFYSTLFNDKSTAIEYCHKNGKLAIKQAENPFEKIKDIPVQEIIVLIN